MTTCLCTTTEGVIDIQATSLDNNTVEEEHIVVDVVDRQPPGQPIPWAIQCLCRWQNIHIENKHMRRRTTERLKSQYAKEDNDRPWRRVLHTSLILYSDSTVFHGIDFPECVDTANFPFVSIEIIVSFVATAEIRYSTGWWCPSRWLWLTMICGWWRRCGGGVYPQYHTAGDRFRKATCTWIVENLWVVEDEGRGRWNWTEHLR